MQKFKDGEVPLLIASDVAARGLDIAGLSHVFNFDVPMSAEDYVHRIGRTGRAGAIGTSISFACEEDSFLLPAIEEKLCTKLDCTHPDDDLLKVAPTFVRHSRIKKKDRLLKKR